MPQKYLTLISSPYQHYGGGGCAVPMGKPQPFSALYWHTFPHVEGEEASMSWAEAHCLPIGERLLGHPAVLKP